MVKIGPDTILTGFVDRYVASISANSHTVEIIGRSKGQDLADCAIAYPGNQVSGVTVQQLAETLAKPYGVTVSAPDGAGKTIPQLNLMLGERVFEVIERVARWSRFLVYDDTAGNLVLARVGKEKHSSGFRQGANVQTAQATFAMDQRFSEYVAYIMSFSDTMLATAVGTAPGSGNQQGVAKDEGVPRFRRHVIISEQANEEGKLIALDRAKWEAARRFGRSQAITLTADSWRDSAGLLWQPNRRASVHLPALKITEAEWVISEVSYQRGGSDGTVASITLMPPQAFELEPTILLPFLWQVTRELEKASLRDPKSPNFNRKIDEPAGGV